MLARRGDSTGSMVGSALDRTVLRTWAGERENARQAAVDLEELRAYLGGAFDEELLLHADQRVTSEADAAPDEVTFYRTSEAYLYDLTNFASGRTKVPYRTAVRRVVRPGARLLDYGCGIGCDGLRLWEAGYHVDFTDFENPGLRYLRWRLDHRGIDGARVFDVEGAIPGGYDLAYSFDVIEHVDDPIGFLERMESLATIVAVNFLERHPLDIDVHHDLPIEQLLDRAERGGLLHYRVHYGRSHFVIYHSPAVERSTSTASRLRSIVQRRMGPLLATPVRIRAGLERRLGSAIDARA